MYLFACLAACSRRSSTASTSLCVERFVSQSIVGLLLLILCVLNCDHIWNSSAMFKNVAYLKILVVGCFKSLLLLTF